MNFYKICGNLTKENVFMNTNSQSDMGKYYKLLIKFSRGEKSNEKGIA